MSKVVTAVTIGKLIDAHNTGDTEKFKSYAQFIADALQENNTVCVSGVANSDITATIWQLIDAHNKSNNEEFNSYVQFLIDVYQRVSSTRSADIIRKYMSGTYKNESKVVLD